MNRFLAARTFRTNCDRAKEFCKNNGICTAATHEDAAVCDCTETPYSGARCMDKCGELPSHCETLNDFRMNNTKIPVGLNGGNCTQPGLCTCTSLWKGSLCEIVQGTSSCMNACDACFRRSMPFQSLSTQDEVFTNCKICLYLTNLNHFLFCFRRAIPTSKSSLYILIVKYS